MEYPGGVGLSGWHYLRKDFGFDLGILIDPHNNYMLSFMSFGIIGGIVYQWQAGNLSNYFSSERDEDSDILYIILCFNN